MPEMVPEAEAKEVLYQAVIIARDIKGNLVYKIEHNFNNFVDAQSYCADCLSSIGNGRIVKVTAELTMYGPGEMLPLP